MQLGPPPGWHRHPATLAAVREFHAHGRPMGGVLAPAPWGGAIHVGPVGGGFGSFLKTAIRWLSPKLASAARAALPVLGSVAGDVTREAARSALAGEGSLAERLRRGQMAGSRTAREQALGMLS